MQYFNELKSPNHTKMLKLITCIPGMKDHNSIRGIMNNVVMNALK